MIAPNHIPPDSPRAKSPADPQPSPIDDILRDVRELVILARHYVTARKDSALLQARRILIACMTAVVALAAVLIAVGSAVVFLLIGAADGIGAGLGHIWLGYVIVGTLILLATAGFGALSIGFRINAARQKTIRKYDLQHSRQRATLGHDVRR